MTKFTSDKNKGIKQSKKQERKQRLKSLSWEQVLDTSECFSSKNFQVANKDGSLQYTW